MKCRVCGQEIGNSFQLVCDSCTRREEEAERQEEEDHYAELEIEEGSTKTKGFLESPRKKLGDVEK